MSIGETIDVAINAIEKMDKYGWHDLRKDPNNLPDKDGIFSVIVDVCFSNGVGGYIEYSGVYCYESMKPVFYTRKDGKRVCKYRGAKSGKWYSMGLEVDVIAWKYKEPFEVEE